MSGAGPGSDVRGRLLPEIALAASIRLGRQRLAWLAPAVAGLRKPPECDGDHNRRRRRALPIA